jgi:hypothetical protein
MMEAPTSEISSPSVRPTVAEYAIPAARTLVNLSLFAVNPDLFDSPIWFPRGF